MLVCTCGRPELRFRFAAGRHSIDRPLGAFLRGERTREDAYEFGDELVRIAVEGR